ncbi:TetR/AcrR family transcriptional regulator [Sedimentitalea sp. HM32M-2]|uniref:TetR/AcrR family transcriptional regulator n=1 Tax=Sedimentitalea sp. HM32M-2 TaxID=3351566 RepID=UPI00362F1657
MSQRKPAADRKDDIRAATLALAFEVGPDRVTTGMVADRLGLTQPAIYKHFPRKEDLWLSITEHLCAEITGNIARETRHACPVARLRGLVLGHLRLVHATPAMPAIMVAPPGDGAQSLVRSGIRNRMEGFFDALLAAVRAAQSEGWFRAEIDARDIALLVMGVVQSLVLRLLISRNPEVLLKDADRLLDLQLSTFTRHGERP